MSIKGPALTYSLLIIMLTGYCYVPSHLAAQDSTFTVTVEDEQQEHPHYNQGYPDKFAIDGSQDPELTLIRGKTYYFVMNNVPSVHPFYLTTDPVGAGADPYNEGVTNNGISGNDTLIFQPSSSTPDSLYYNCTNHDYMGTEITIEDPRRLARDRSLFFDGSSYVQIPYSNTFDVDSSITIEGWFRSTDIASTWRGIISANNDTTTSEGWTIWLNTNNLMEGDIEFNPDNTICSDCRTWVDRFEWHHVALTYNGSKMSLYYDGQLLGRKVDISGDIVNRTHPIHIGSQFENYRNFRGYVDLVRISDTARYNSEFTPPLSISTDRHTIGLWTFNTGSGDTLYDKSGNGNHGIISGARWSKNVPPDSVSGGLLASYPFDGNADDMTGNGYHGAIHGAVSTSDRFGDTASAFRFDGTDDYIEVDSFPNLSNQDFSVSVWFKTDSFKDSRQQRIFADDKFNNGWWLTLTEKSTGGLTFGMRTKNTGHTVIKDTGVNAGQWYHAVATYQKNSGTMKLYVNAEKRSEGVESNPDTDQGNLNIGRDDTSSVDTETQYFDGKIDDILVYDRTLTNTQVKRLFDQQKVLDTALTWAVTIEARSSGYSDTDNVLGAAEKATDGFDKYFDKAEPPLPPGDYVNLYFPHPEWNVSLGERFTQDVRPNIDQSDTMQVWDFKVESTVTDTVELSFLDGDSIEVPVIVEDRTNGVTFNIDTSNTYKFSAMADTTYPFSISVGDTTAPTVEPGPFFANTQILHANKDYKMTWSAADGYRVAKAWVEASADSGANFRKVAEGDSTEVLTWTAPDASVNKDYILRLKVRDFAGNTRSEQSDQPIALAGDTLSERVKTGWRLIGFPVKPDNVGFQHNLSDDFNAYWDFFEYRDGGYKIADTLKTLQGYWLGTLEDSTNIDVGGTAIRRDQTIALEKGWNLVSNPFIFATQVDSLVFKKADEQYGYQSAIAEGWISDGLSYVNRGYSSISVLDPWQGIWLPVMTDSLAMSIPLHDQRSIVSAQPERERLIANKVSQGWTLQVKGLIKGEVKDRITYLGTNEKATEAFDPDLDKPKPPVPPTDDYVSLALVNEKVDIPLGNKLTRDMRSHDKSKTHKWMLKTETAADSATISWNTDEIPSGWDLGFKRTDQSDYISMRSVGSVKVVAGQKLDIRARGKGLAVGEEDEIPQQYRLYQNQPNPFNPSTTIRYDLPEESHVTINLYNIVGRKLKTIVDKQKQAGSHTVRIDGSEMSSGVYLYRIEAGEFIEVKKMTLVK